jgi:heme-degrading monooxygenase HmoA
MYVRVLTFVCRADVRESDISSVFHELVSSAETKEGFEGATLLMSEDTCRGMGMIYWRDRDAASAAGPALVELLNQQIHGLLEHPPDIAGYDVIEDRVISNRSK